MEEAYTRPQIHESGTVESITIPAEIAEALDSLPGAHTGRKLQLPVWVDDVLRKYWRKKRKAEVAELIGVSEGVLRRRARELGI